MRPILLSVLAVLMLPASAAIAASPIVPPGNSGTEQYVDSYPTASGARPAVPVHGGGSGASAQSNGSGASAGSGSVTPATAAALIAQGADGRAAAAIARRTAPASTGAQRGTGAAAGSAGGHSSAGAGSSGAGPSDIGTSSPAASVVKALTGLSTKGGLGSFLPIALIVTLIGAVGLALRRRRSD